jgi:SAM-dependent methyltransferase
LSDTQHDSLQALAQADQYTRWILSAITPFLPPTNQPGSVLEIGCGIGSYSLGLLAHAQRLVALDIDPDFVTATQQRLSPLVQANQTVTVALHNVFGPNEATNVAFSGPFDTIVLLNVLEHLPDDVASLKQLLPLLGQHGRLLIWVPALPALLSPYDRLIGHYRRYTKHSLLACLTAAGLTLEHCAYHNLLGILGWWVQFCLLQKTQFAVGSVRVFNAMATWLFALEQRYQPPVGLSLLAVATRAKLC